MLPWQQHITARHAKWAGVLLHGLSTAASAELPFAPPPLRAPQVVGRRGSTRVPRARVALPVALPGTAPTAAGLRRRRRDDPPPLRATGTCDQPAWVALCRIVLVQHFPAHQPAFALLALAARPVPVAGRAPESALPPPMQRMVVALRALGPPLDDPQLPPVQPGRWAYQMPVWGNPLLRAEGSWGLPLDQATALLSSEPALRSFYSLQASMWRHLDLATGEAREEPRQLPVEHVGSQEEAAAREAVQERVAGLATLLWDSMPAVWAQYMPPRLGPAAVTEQGVVAAVCGRLMWQVRLPGGGQRSVSLLRDWAVRDITPLLTGGVAQQQHGRRVQYAADALAQGWARPLAAGGPAVAPGQRAGPGPAAGGAAAMVAVAAAPVVDGEDGARRLLARMPALWRLLWGNQRKDVLWRLSLMGVRGAGGHDVCMGGACACGWDVPAGARDSPEAARAVGAPAQRAHAFWSCPVAQSVVAAVQGALPLPAGGALHCCHLWLCITPHPRVQQGVWDVVCLAALNAMQTGRKLLWKLGRERGEALAAGGVQLTLQQAWGVGPAPPTVLQRAQRAAVAHFWANVQDFVQLHRVPTRWEVGARLPSNHPFIAAEPGPRVAGQDGRIRVVLPPGVAAEGQGPGVGEAAAGGPAAAGED